MKFANTAYAPGGRLHWIARARARRAAKPAPVTPTVRLLSMPLHFPLRETPGELVVPSNIGPEDFPILDAIVAYLRSIAKANGERKGVRHEPMVEEE